MTALWPKVVTTFEGGKMLGNRLHPSSVAKLLNSPHQMKWRNEELAIQ